MSDKVEINLTHHEKNELCTTRPAYRQGRKYTSVKVDGSIYTVNKESQHLLIYNVPAINIDLELLQLCQRFGEVIACTRIPTKEVEEFTHAYHAHFSKVHYARSAKRKMDDLSFYGGILHVCYAPELETVDETKEKLSIRRKEVAFHLKKLAFPQLFPDRKPFKRKRNINDDGRTLYNNAHSGGYNHIGNQMSTSGVSSIPGPSRIQSDPPSQTEPVNVTPFKKLIPTKVSRIVFYNNDNSTK